MNAPPNTETATAASSGASATERFQHDESAFAAVRDTPPERVGLLAHEFLSAVHDAIRRHQVTYAEYNALKAWLIQVGEDGEWPLLELVRRPWGDASTACWCRGWRAAAWRCAAPRPTTCATCCA